MEAVLICLPLVGGSQDRRDGVSRSLDAPLADAHDMAPRLLLDHLSEQQSALGHQAGAPAASRVHGLAKDPAQRRDVA